MCCSTHTKPPRRACQHIQPATSQSSILPWRLNSKTNRLCCSIRIPLLHYYGKRVLIRLAKRHAVLLDKSVYLWVMSEPCAAWIPIRCSRALWFNLNSFPNAFKPASTNTPRVLNKNLPYKQITAVEHCIITGCFPQSWLWQLNYT